MTAQGSAYMRFRRALDRENVTEALSAASELGFVGLAEALELTLLLADKKPGKYDRAAARWHVRFLQEVPNIDLREDQAVVALLAAIPANRHAATALADLLSGRRSCERIAEALVHCMSRTARAVLAGALVVVAASCGGGSSNETPTVGGVKTFEGEGYSFTYPGSWVERTGIESSSGSGGGVCIGPPEGADLLFIGTSGLDIAITEGNIAFYADDLTAFVDKVFRQAEGQVTSAVPHLPTVAGLPAIRLEATAINLDGVETKSHVVLVYDGKTEYFLNCQYTPDGAAEMTAGCDQVVASFQVKSDSTATATG